MNDKQKDCDHEKVYANYILTSDPPRYSFICKKCGFKGVVACEDIEIIDEYEELDKKFKKDNKKEV